MRNLFFAIIFFLALAAPAYALSTTLESSYAQGETIIVEITGSITSPLHASDVEFLRRHVQVGSFEYDLKRLGDRYFIYAVAPFAPNNYTLVLHNVETTINGQPATMDYTQNFSVTNETSLYTLRPGFIITGQDFNIELESYTDVPQQITVGTRANNTITLAPGINVREIEIEEFDYGLHRISIGQYVFPLYSTYSVSASNATFLPPRIIELDPIRFDHRFIRGRDPYTVTFVIRNTAGRDLSGFTFTYDDELFELKPSRLRKLAANETAAFNITVQGEDSVSEIISITIDDETFEVPLEIGFEEKNATNITIPPLNETVSKNTRAYSCRELNGLICLATQQCSGQEVAASEGVCCRGVCIAKKESNSLAWIGYLIGLMIIVVLLIITRRYFKAKSKARSENPLGKQVSRLEKPF